MTSLFADHRPSLRERQRPATGESFVEGLLQRIQVDQHEHVGQAHHLHPHRRPRCLQRHPRRGKNIGYLWRRFTLQVNERLPFILEDVWYTGLPNSLPFFSSQ